MAALLRVEPVAAAAFTLQKIGASDVGGRRISSWTYMGSNPAFSGTADPITTVTITINGTAATATADATGNWSYTPTTLTGEGTHQVTIASGDQTVAFTLGLSPYSGGTGATLSATTKGGVDELPLSGGLSQTLSLISIGLVLVAMGFASRWIIHELALNYTK